MNNKFLKHFQIKKYVDKFLEIQGLTNDELKYQIANHERSNEISELPGLNNPSRKDSRIVFLTIATVLDLINKKD